MRFKSTLLVFLIFIGLASWFYFQEIKGGKKREEAKERASKLLLFEKGDVQSLRLRNEKGVVFCERDSNEWKITAPVETPGDRSAIDGLLRQLERARIERVVEEAPSSLEEFGLKEPKVEVELAYRGGKKDTLWVGDKNPTNSFVYVRRNGQRRVLLTPSGLLSALQKKLYDLRDKRVLAFKRDDVKQLTLTRGRKSLVCEVADHGWKLKEPLEAKGDRSAINGILSSLQSARAKEFVSEKPKNLAQYGLKHPQIKVDLLLGEERAKKTLLIGKKKDKRFYAKDESRPPVFLVDSYLVDKLKKEPFDLRDKTVVEFDRDKVDKVKIRYGEQLITCQKDTSGGWTMSEPDSAQVKKWKISGLFSNLSGLRAKKFPPPTKRLAKYGLKSPQGEIILYQGGKELCWVQWGKKVDDLVYLRNKLEDKFFMVKQADAERLKLKPEDMKENK